MGLALLLLLLDLSGVLVCIFFVIVGVGDMVSGFTFA